MFLRHTTLFILWHLILLEQTSRLSLGSCDKKLSLRCPRFHHRGPGSLLPVLVRKFNFKDKHLGFVAALSPFFFPSKVNCFNVQRWFWRTWANPRARVLCLRGRFRSLVPYYSAGPGLSMSHSHQELRCWAEMLAFPVMWCFRPLSLLLHSYFLLLV